MQINQDVPKLDVYQTDNDYVQEYMAVQQEFSSDENPTQTLPIADSRFTRSHF